MKKLLFVIYFLFLSIKFFSETTNIDCGYGLYPIKNYALNKYGYIDRNGVLKINFNFDAAREFEDGLAEVEIGENKFLINSEGETISENYNSLNNNRRLVDLHGLYGFVNSKGKLTIPYKYTYAQSFYDKTNLAVVCQNGKYGYIDSIGALSIPLKFDTATYFTNGIAIVSEGGKFYHINNKGLPIYTQRFDMVGSFNDGKAYVRLKNKYGFINRKGIKVTDILFDDCKEFTDGNAFVKIRGKWFLMDKSFQISIRDSFESTKSFFNGMGNVQKNSKWGCIDTSGELVIPFIYDEPIWFWNPVTYAILNGRKITINKKGQQVSGDDVGVAGNGLTPVFKEDLYGKKKWGFADSLGIIRIEYMYSEIGFFRNGFCPVSLNGSNYFFINTSNQKVFNSSYLYANSFHEGYALVHKDNNVQTYIDSLGNEVPYTFEEEWGFRKGSFSQIVSNGKHLVIDIKSGHIYFSLPEGYEADEIFCKDFIRWRYNIGGENASVNTKTGEIYNPGVDYDGYMTSDEKVFFYPNRK